MECPVAALLCSDRLPVPGETISASRPDTGHVMPGGKGANQAVAVARLLDANASEQWQTYWAGRFGRDTHADMLKSTRSNTQDRLD